MALLFAKRGAIVVLCDIDEVANAQTAELITKELALTTNNEKRVFAYKCDIGNRDEVHRLVEKIQRDVGDITMLINNGLFKQKCSFLVNIVCFRIFKAAILSSKSILEMSEEEYSRCLNVNLFAAYWVCSFLYLDCENSCNLNFNRFEFFFLKIHRKFFDSMLLQAFIN